MWLPTTLNIALETNWNYFHGCSLLHERWMEECLECNKSFVFGTTWCWANYEFLGGVLYELTPLTRVQKCWCFELKYKYIWIWPPDLSHVLINCLEPSEQTNQSWSALQTLSLNPSNRQWNSKIIHYFLLTTVWGCPNNHSFISRDPHLKISTKTNLQTRFGLKHNSAVLAFPKGEQNYTKPFRRWKKHHLWNSNLSFFIQILYFIECIWTVGKHIHSMCAWLWFGSGIIPHLFLFHEHLCHYHHILEHCAKAKYSDFHVCFNNTPAVTIVQIVCTVLMLSGYIQISI